MNKRQRVVLLVGTIIFLLLGLFPPYTVTIRSMVRVGDYWVVRDITALRFSCLFEKGTGSPARVPKFHGETTTDYNLDKTVLGLEMLLVLVATIAGILLFMERRGRDGTMHYQAKN